MSGIAKHVQHRARWAAITAAAVALAGAAAASAQTTTLQQWPADAVGKSYRFDAPQGGLEQTLDYQTYRDMVRASIGSTGLVETQEVASARFTVSFRYGTERSQVTVIRDRDPFFNDPYYPRGGYYGPHGYYGHGGWGVGANIHGGSRWEPVQTEVYRNSLTVEIRDSERNGAQVYQSTAVTMGRSDQLNQAMPQLVQTVFDRFPANNGETREVRGR